MIDLEELERLAKGATPGPWFMAGPPWLANDVETYVLADSPDPHAGTMIFDMPTADMAGVEDRFEDEEWRARNDANAKYVSHCDPQTVLSLIAVARAAQKLAASLHITEGQSYTTAWADNMRAKYDGLAATLTPFSKDGEG